MIANRYARALLALAAKRGCEDAVRHDMKELQKVLERKKLRDFLFSRLVPAADRIAAFSSFDGLTRDFLRLVLANRREEYLPLICREYMGLFNRRRNIADAEVTSRMPLLENEKKLLKAKLDGYMNRRIEMRCRTDRRMSGGVKVLCEGMVIDGTVGGMLSSLLRSMAVK